MLFDLGYIHKKLFPNLVEQRVDCSDTAIES